MPSHDVGDLCSLLRTLQRDRKFVIAMQVSSVNRACAHIVGLLGVPRDDAEAERKKAWARAERIVKTAVAGKDQRDEDSEIAHIQAFNLGMLGSVLNTIEVRRDEIETEMKRLAMELPVAEKFVAKTAGFGAICLAVIVGEAGDLSNYATKRKLWRRLGYGMAPGHEEHAYSTWRMKKGLSSDDWVIAGYSPKRLGQIYGVVTVPLVMHKGKNKYGAIYEARYHHTMKTHPDWFLDKSGKPKVNPKTGEPSSAHAAADAARIMTKALLADLLEAWKGSFESLGPRPSIRVDPPESCQASRRVVDAGGGPVEP